MGKQTEAQVARRLDAQKYADLPLDEAAKAIWNEQFQRGQEAIIRVVERMTGREAEPAEPWDGRAVCSVDGVEFCRDRDGIIVLPSCTLCGKPFPLRAHDLGELGFALRYVDEHDGHCKDCRDAVQLARRQKLAQKEAK